MVFLQKNLKRTIMVHPQYLGERLKQHIKEQCSAELLGTSLDGVGYVIMVIEIQDHQIGKGLVDHLTGFTRFEVEFGAVIYRPFKNEVMDTVVASCTPYGFFAEAGPINIFVAQINMSSDYTFHEDGSWVSNESGAVMRPGVAVRVKVIGTTVYASGIGTIGTINEPFLGPLL